MIPPLYRTPIEVQIMNACLHNQKWLRKRCERRKRVSVPVFGEFSGSAGDGANGSEREVVRSGNDSPGCRGGGEEQQAPCSSHRRGGHGEGPSSREQLGFSGYGGHDVMPIGSPPCDSVFSLLSCVFLSRLCLRCIRSLPQVCHLLCRLEFLSSGRDEYRR